MFSHYFEVKHPIKVKYYGSRNLKVGALGGKFKVSLSFFMKNQCREERKHREGCSVSTDIVS